MTSEIRAILFLLVAMALGGVGTMYALLRDAESRAATCAVSIKEQNSAIESLAKDGKAQEALQVQKDRQAANDAKSSEEGALSIMGERVPNQCEQAVQWGIEQAKKMRPQ